MSNEHRQLFTICGCGTPEHQFILSYFTDEEPEWRWLYLNVHLTTWRNPFRRLLAAVRYVFGYRCRFGEFDEVVMYRHHAEQVRDFLNEFIEETQ